MNIYVGNLPFSTTEAELADTFTQHGTVDNAKVITDRETGRSRGFGFVEMPDDSEAQAAIEALNGTEMDGRPLTVNEARPRR
jgi:RNA recognition motif-containing protein